MKLFSAEEARVAADSLKQEHPDASPQLVEMKQPNYTMHILLLGPFNSAEALQAEREVLVENNISATTIAWTGSMEDAINGTSGAQD